MSEPTEFNPVHAVCVRLRDRPCKLCPARLDTVYGRGAMIGCYMLAQETINIAVHGNPWGADAKPAHVVRWQKRFNEE